MKTLTIPKLDATESPLTMVDTQTIPQLLRKKFLYIRTSGIIHCLAHDNILYLQADGNYCNIYTVHQKITSSKTLKYYMDQLPKSTFFRCHQSYVVNMNHVKMIYPSGGYEMVLSDDKKIPVARSKHSIIQQFIH